MKAEPTWSEGWALQECTQLGRDKVRAVIADHVLFAALDGKQKEMLADSFFLREYAKGDTVIRQGEEGNLFYIIEQGVLSVHIKPEDTITGYQKVKTYHQGESFGELALLYNQPRAALVTALFHVFAVPGSGSCQVECLEPV